MPPTGPAVGAAAHTAIFVHASSAGASTRLANQPGWTTRGQSHRGDAAVTCTADIPSRHAMLRGANINVFRMMAERRRTAVENLPRPACRDPQASL